MNNPRSRAAPFPKIQIICAPPALHITVLFRVAPGTVLSNFRLATAAFSTLPLLHAPLHHGAIPAPQRYDGLTVHQALSEREPISDPVDSDPARYWIKGLNPAPHTIDVLPRHQSGLSPLLGTGTDGLIPYRTHPQDTKLRYVRHETLTRFH